MTEMLKGEGLQAQARRDMINKYVLTVHSVNVLNSSIHAKQKLPSIHTNCVHEIKKNTYKLIRQATPLSTAKDTSLRANDTLLKGAWQ